MECGSCHELLALMGSRGCVRCSHGLGNFPDALVTSPRTPHVVLPLHWQPRSSNFKSRSGVSNNGVGKFTTTNSWGAEMVIMIKSRGHTNIA